MADFVVDSTVWVAALVSNDPHHQRAQQFFQEFRQGLHLCHLSRLVLVEVCAAIIRRTQSRGLGLAVHGEFIKWGQQGLIRWYDLDAQRMEQAVGASMSYRLRGADSVIVALADELQIPVRTFDNEILQRYPKAQT